MYAGHRVVACTIALLVSLGVGCDSTTEVGGRSNDIAERSVEPVPKEPVVTKTEVKATDTKPEVIARSVSFAELKFELDDRDEYSRELLPTVAKDIVGTRVRITGYIYPDVKIRNISEFALIGYKSASFGHVYGAGEIILVEMRKGAFLKYTDDQLTIEGTFAIEEMRYKDELIAVYTLVNAVSVDDRQH